MNCQMIRVISSPSSSTTGFATLIFVIADLCKRRKPRSGPGRGGRRHLLDGGAPRGRRYSTGSEGVKVELPGVWLFPRRERRYTSRVEEPWRAPEPTRPSVGSRPRARG